MKFSGHYLKIEEVKKSFDWPGFKNGVSNYKGDDLTFDVFSETTINQGTVSVQSMVKKIVDFLAKALAVTIDTEALAATIEATFTNLKSAKSNGWADFSSSSHQSNSSWEYRIQFAVPNQDLTDFFWSLVTTIKLEADIQEESSWWGLQSSTEKNFSATIDAMRLVVMKGFKDPGN